jgi:molecular chaperone GrpE
MSEKSETDLNPTPNPAAAGENPGAPTDNAPVAEDQLAMAKKEAAAAQERYLRAVADLENFRKRTVREKDELRQFAASGVIEDLIPVLDNLNLGLAAANQTATDPKSVVQGVTMVLEQFKTALVRHGLKEINPLGAVFDPNLHDCISHQPSKEVKDEHVMQVVRTGYSLNGRLLRPASVIVSSGPTKTGEAKA